MLTNDKLGRKNAAKCSKMHLGNLKNDVKVNDKTAKSDKKYLI